MPNMVELQDIQKSYPMGDITVPVLKGISLTIARGELVALMGASGSGKSTLMNILGCLDCADGGVYRLDGEEMAHLSTDQRAVIRNGKLGFVFQSFNLLPRTSALDNVALPLTYAAGHLSEREARRRAARMLEQVGLAERMGHEPTQLSGGQQQRVAIARALINQPALLLADEPTGNLDSRTGAEVLDMFRKLNHHEGITMILVTHDPQVARYAQRVIHIHDGMIVDRPADPAAYPAPPAPWSSP